MWSSNETRCLQPRGQNGGALRPWTKQNSRQILPCPLYFPFCTQHPVTRCPHAAFQFFWGPPLRVPSKFFLPLAHLNQNSLSLSPQLIRSDYLIKLIRTEVWMRLNPPRSICILKEELVNPNASTISRMCGKIWGTWGFPVLPAS